MTHRGLILLCVAFLVALPLVVTALDAATRRPPKPQPRECVRVRDEGVGSYLICGERFLTR